MITSNTTGLLLKRQVQSLLPTGKKKRRKITIFTLFITISSLSLSTHEAELRYFKKAKHVNTLVYMHSTRKAGRIQNYHIYHILARKIRDMRMPLPMQSQFHPKDDLDK